MVLLSSLVLVDSTSLSAAVAGPLTHLRPTRSYTNLRDVTQYAAARRTSEAATVNQRACRTTLDCDVNFGQRGRAVAVLSDQRLSIEVNDIVGRTAGANHTVLDQ